MEIPWTEVLGGATGGVAVLLVAVIVLAKLLIERIVDAAAKRFEEEHKDAVATAAAIDTDLRARRIPLYAELWALTGKLPRWPEDAGLTYADLAELGVGLRAWYFEKGGMYLSRSAQKAYGEVQEAIQACVGKGASGKVSRVDYGAVRERCSELRTELTIDLQSRREAPLRAERR